MQSDYYLDETWVDCPGFPGYAISDYGRIWSYKSNKMMHPSPYKNGHLRYGLRKDGKYYFVQLSRLLAEAFIPNPNNYPIVRHLNDIPDDNDISNLAWGTQRDNVRDSILNGGIHYVAKEERELGCVKRRRRIRATELSSGRSLVFDGISTAARELGVNATCISKVLRGVRRHAGGYYFEYAEKGVIEDGYY